MTTQTTMATDLNNLTKVEKFWIGLRAVDDAFNYDPQEQLYESHKRLNQQVERLQAKV